MRFLLLAAAAPITAFAVCPAPARAEHPSAFSAAPGQFDQFSALPRVHRGVGADRNRHGRDRHRRLTGTVVVGDWYGGEWALNNNRSWEPDSFNDWWHDRPDRAYPRWFQNNQNCDRMWWGGGAWRCGW